MLVRGGEETVSARSQTVYIYVTLAEKQKKSRVQRPVLFVLRVELLLSNTHPPLLGGCVYACIHMSRANK